MKVTVLSETKRKKETGYEAGVTEKLHGWSMYGKNEDCKSCDDDSGGYFGEERAVGVRAFARKQKRVLLRGGIAVHCDSHPQKKELYLELCRLAYPSVDGSGSRARASMHQLRSCTGACSQACTLCCGGPCRRGRALNGTHFLATERQLRCRAETHGRSALVPKGRRYRRHRQV